MSILFWWKERLVAQHPFHRPKTPDIDYRMGADNPSTTWPALVQRTTLFKDYQTWHEEVYLAAYKGVEYYQESPDRMPMVATELEFFNIIRPFVYLHGRNTQVRSIKIPEQVHYQGRWVELRKYKYFIKLCPLAEHCAAFELYTGMSLSTDVKYYEEEKAKILALAADAEEKKAEDRRKAMEDAMSRD